MKHHSFGHIHILQARLKPGGIPFKHWGGRIIFVPIVTEQVVRVLFGVQEVHTADIGHGGVHVDHVVAHAVQRVHTVDGVLLREVGRDGVGRTCVVDGRVLQPHGIGPLDGTQLARGLAQVVDGAIVAHVDAVVHVAAVGRGAGTDNRVHDVHQRQAAVGVVHIGVVALAVHTDAALAAIEARFREVGVAHVVTPVGTAVDGGLQLQLGGRQGRHTHLAPHAVARLEFGVAVFIHHVVAAAVLAQEDVARPHGAVVHSLEAHVDIHRAVHVAQIAAAVDVVLDGAARQVDNRRGAQVGVGGRLALAGIAVVDVLRAAIDRLLDQAAVDVQLLEAVDNPIAARLTGAAGIDVVLEGAAVHVDDDIGIGFGGVGHQGRIGRRVGDGVALAVGQRAEGVGHLAGTASVGEPGTLGVALVAHGGAHLAATEHVAVHRAVKEVDLRIFVVGLIEALRNALRKAVLGVSNAVVAGIDTVVHAAHRACGTGVVALGIVAVAAAVDEAVLAVAHGDFGLADAAREVVAAIDVVGSLGLAHVTALQVHVGAHEHIRTPAAAVDGLEGDVPRGVGVDVGVLHVAALAAAIGFGEARGVAQIGGVVQVQVAGCRVVVGGQHIAVARLVQVLPVALATGIEGAGDGQVGIGDFGRAYLVVHNHVGGAAVTQGTAAEDVGGDGAAVEVDRGGVHKGTSRGAFDLQGGGVMGGRLEGVDIPRAIDIVVVVFAVRAAVDVAHRAAADVDTRVAADGAADVVAAKDVVHRAAADLHVCHAAHLGHAAAAVDGAVDDGVVIVDADVGRHTGHLVAAGVGEGAAAIHGTHVAAAEHIAHAPFVQHDVGHARRHVVAVVAAEDGAHHPVGVGRAVEQHDDALAHAGAVAAAEDGVDTGLTRIILMGVAS